MIQNITLAVLLPEDVAVAVILTRFGFKKYTIVKAHDFELLKYLKVSKNWATITYV